MSKEKKDKHFVKKPYYEGGRQAMKAFISKELKYPKEALQKKVEGTVNVRYTIDHQGKVIDVRIISGPGYGCEEEAERLVKKLKFKVPKSRGVKVQFQKTLQIHFRLPVEKNQGSKEANMQLQYNYTSKERKDDQKGKSGGYEYTIQF